MKSGFAINIDIPVGATHPEKFHQVNDEKPGADFIVSRNRDGSVASFYRERTWNLSAYHPEEKPSILNFEFWTNGTSTKKREDLIEESKLIVFILMWLRNGPSLSIGTLRNYLIVINELARHCENTNLEFRELLADENKLWRFVESQNSGWIIQTLGSLLPHLTQNKFGFELVGEKFIQAIKARGMQYRATLNQHSPIPTRIYSEIISQLTGFISTWNTVANDMLSIAKTCNDNPMAGRCLTNQIKIASTLGLPRVEHPTFSNILTKKCLDYFQTKKITQTVTGLSGVLTEAQLACKLTIQTFTGMRDDEAISLPYNCLKIQKINGIEHYIVLGRTTKLNNSRRKPTQWITNIDGYKAIKAAQQIAETIYSTFSIYKKGLESDATKYPLFASIGYLGLTGARLKPEDGRFRPNKIGLTRFPRLRKLLEPIITKHDISELERIDPHRAWRSEEHFQIGKPWRFTSHQLRRSLALYAQKSGLVSLPSLRRQLQHITNEMSLYYSRGSIYAKNFIDDKEHFGSAWQETKFESEGLSYILNVILSDDVLFGGHAQWVKNKFQGPNGTVVFDRERTIQQFKRGEIAYRETLLGGCTSTEPCKQPALKWINTDCIENGCRNLVCHSSKLDMVIAAQEKLVNSIDKNLVEYRTEKSDLDILIKAREKAVRINSKG